MLLHKQNAVLGIRSRSHFFYQCICPSFFIKSIFLKFSFLTKILTFALRIGSICLVLYGQTHKERVPRFASVVKWWISIWSDDLNFWHLKWIWQNHKKACGILARYILTYRASLISFAFNVKKAWIQNFRCFTIGPKLFWTCTWFNFCSPLIWFRTKLFCQ
jgi:hypothetical protein